MQHRCLRTLQLKRMHLAGLKRPARHLQVILILHRQPALRRPTQRTGKAKCHFRADAALLLQNPVQRRGRHAKLRCQIAAAQAAGLHIGRRNKFTGMGRVVHIHQWDP